MSTLVHTTRFSNYFHQVLSTSEAFTISISANIPPIFSDIRVTRSLIGCLKFCRSLFVFCLLSFFFCPLCSSSSYRFWLSLWYLQALFRYV